MPQSLTKILIHIIYAPKNQERILSEHVRYEIHRYTAAILKEWESCDHNS